MNPAALLSNPKEMSLDFTHESSSTPVKPQRDDSGLYPVGCCELSAFGFRRLPRSHKKRAKLCLPLPLVRQEALGLCLAELSPLWATSWFLLFLLLQGLELVHQIKCLKSCPGFQLSRLPGRVWFQVSDAALGKTLCVFVALAGEAAKEHSWCVPEEKASSRLSCGSANTFPIHRKKKKKRDKRGKRYLYA